VGSWFLVAGLIVFFANLARALLRGRKAEADPWGGMTLEWKISSPPPAENFGEIPVITQWPYTYNPRRSA
jgi:cytochrome c oxidase subunit 1